MGLRRLRRGSLERPSGGPFDDRGPGQFWNEADQRHSARQDYPQTSPHVPATLQSRMGAAPFEGPPKGPERNVSCGAAGVQTAISPENTPRQPPTGVNKLSVGNPPPVPARKTQCSGATFRRAVFSAKEVPGAQDLSPRAQTHLPFGCSVVGVMWKPKASLNLQKKIFISRSLYGSWSAVCQNQPLVQWICSDLQICKRRFDPLAEPPKVCLHFLSLGSATHRSFFALFVTWL